MNLWDMDAPDPDDRPEPGQDRRSTPEKLEAYLRAYAAQGGGKMPSLAEIKAEFGGVLSVFVDAWELRRRGVLSADWRLVEQDHG